MRPSDDLGLQLDTLGGLVAGTRPDQLDEPTPCTEWRVRHLLQHLIGGGHLYGALFAGQAPPPAPADADDLLGDDLGRAWTGAAAAATAGIDSAGALERIVTLPNGVELPGAVVFDLLKVDLLVHAWDLARSTGQPLDMSDDAVEPALALARQLIGPELRGDQLFAAATQASADAPTIDRLAAFCGRAV